MSPVPLALIGGLVSAAGGVTSSLLQSRANKKNRDFQEEQNRINREIEEKRFYEQRRMALKDWHMQNEYNSPVEQMNRLRQAGLNPHLIYGKGADATAEAIRTSQYGSVNAPAPKFDTNVGQGIQAAGNAIAGSFQQIYDLKAKQAQIDNVNQSTALMQQENLFKQASTAKTLQDTAKSKFDLGQAQELKDSVIQQAKLNNEKSRADIQFTLDENQRKAMTTTQDVKLTAEKIITEKIAHAKDNQQIELLKAQLEQLKQSTHIATYEKELTDMGIYKSDPWYFRALMNLVNGNMQNPIQEPINNGLNKLRGTESPKYNPEGEQQFNKRKY